MALLKYAIILASSLSITSPSYANSEINRAVSLLKIACVTGGERVVVEADGQAGLNLRNIRNLGVGGNVKIKRENINGLIDKLTSTSIQNAQSVRDCMSPYISEIFSIWNQQEYSASTSATEKSATASGSSARTSCVGWAGPEGATSSCSDADGKTVSSRAMKDGANSAGENVQK